METIAPAAPTGGDVVEYDRRHLALYAAMLDANDAGLDWTDAARSLMGIDVAEAGAEACWQSHLDRARWIIGNGLEKAVSAFGRSA